MNSQSNSESELSQIQKVAQGLGILAKYDPKGSVCAEHDEIFAGGGSKTHPDKISPEDVARLDVLGFSFDEKFDSWHRFV